MSMGRIDCAQVGSSASTQAPSKERRTPLFSSPASVQLKSPPITHGLPYCFSLHATSRSAS
eukprot:4802169-Pyramimonas_sp.AAC.1